MPKRLGLRVTQSFRLRLAASLCHCLRKVRNQRDNQIQKAIWSWNPKFAPCPVTSRIVEIAAPTSDGWCSEESHSILPQPRPPSPGQLAAPPAVRPRARRTTKKICARPRRACCSSVATRICKLTACQTPCSFPITFAFNESHSMATNYNRSNKLAYREFRLPKYSQYASPRLLTWFPDSQHNL